LVGGIKVYKIATFGGLYDVFEICVVDRCSLESAGGFANPPFLYPVGVRVVAKCDVEFAVVILPVEAVEARSIEVYEETCFSNAVLSSVFS
jgi:hypothetical protein